MTNETSDAISDERSLALSKEWGRIVKTWFERDPARNTAGATTVKYTSPENTVMTGGGHTQRSLKEKLSQYDLQTVCKRVKEGGQSTVSFRLEDESGSYDQDKAHDRTKADAKTGTLTIGLSDVPPSTQALCASSKALVGPLSHLGRRKREFANQHEMGVEALSFRQVPGKAHTYELTFGNGPREEFISRAHSTRASLERIKQHVDQFVLDSSHAGDKFLQLSDKEPSELNINWPILGKPVRRCRL